ncbi:MliC family protein [bacterium]|jgi:membrane-bound inhibitor of C-type lysozyme|nr:MliC family protein [bacterium]
MNKMYALIAAAIVILSGSLWYYTSLNIETAHNDALPPKPQQQRGHEESPPPESSEVSAHGGEEALATFTCSGGKTMTAVFVRDLVDLTLSDGRQLTLNQAISGSGIRYTNSSETIEFRGKGNDAYLQEGESITYADCVAAE